MQHGRSLVAVTHRLIAADRPVRLELVPLCTWRDQHGDRRANGAPQVEPVDGGFVFEGRYRVRGGVDGRRRVVPRRLPAGRGRARARPHRGPVGRRLLRRRARAGRVAGRRGLRRPLDDAPPAAGELVRAALAAAAGWSRRPAPRTRSTASSCWPPTSFVIATASGPTTIAGYPWFGEWSRDTMTSYEGLLLETGRAEEGRALLLRAAATLSEGMLANTADAGGLEYNTADGTLWLVHAVGRHVERTGDQDLAAALADDLQSVIEHHVAGTRFGIRCDADGLITQGADGWALTWMDARVDGRPVTQRAGKAVDINALWIAALGTVAQLQAPPAATRAAGRPARPRRPELRAALRARRRPRAVRRGRRPGRRRRLDPSEPAAGAVAAERAGRAAEQVRVCAASSCSPRSGCARSRPGIPATAAGTGAARPSATPPTTRAPCGRGSSGRSPRRTAAGASSDRACSAGSRRTSPRPASARSRRPPTATPRTAPPAVPSRPGRSPS